MAAALAATPFNSDHLAALSEHSAALLVPFGPMIAAALIPASFGWRTFGACGVRIVVTWGLTFAAVWKAMSDQEKADVSAVLAAPL